MQDQVGPPQVMVDDIGIQHAPISPFSPIGANLSIKFGWAVCGTNLGNNPDRETVDAEQHKVCPMCMELMALLVVEMMENIHEIQAQLPTPPAHTLN